MGQKATIADVVAGNRPLGNVNLSQESEVTSAHFLPRHETLLEVTEHVS